MPICQRCHYTWKTKSTFRYISCPKCITKVKNTDYIPPSSSKTSNGSDSTTPNVLNALNKNKKEEDEEDLDNLSFIIKEEEKK